jgi:3-hydroxybutyryl-CoA dehydrogenase
MEIAKVGVLGCGLMGHGIAQICAQAGWDVVSAEIDQGALDKGIAKIEKQLARAVDKGRLEQADADAIRARITPTLDYDELADCDLVIEAITEDLDRKLELWRRVDEIVKDDAFFATNTSSLGVAQQAAATKRADRFLGLHFFNPAQVMPLLEVVRADGTGETAYDLGFELG